MKSSFSSNLVKVLLIFTLFANASTHQLHSDSESRLSYFTQTKAFEAFKKRFNSKADENLKQAEKDSEPGNFALRFYIKAALNLFESEEAEEKSFFEKLKSAFKDKAQENLEFKLGVELGFKKFMKQPKKNQVFPAELVVGW